MLGSKGTEANGELTCRENLFLGKKKEMPSKEVFETDKSFGGKANQTKSY